MHRKTYFYALLPALMLLNSGASISGLLGATLALAVGSVLGLVCWMLVWRRLYGAYPRTTLRPEFSILAILPQEAFYVLNTAGAEAAAPFAEGIWPGIHLLLWMASVWVLLSSFSPRCDGSPSSGWKDPGSLVAGAFVLLVSFVGWTSNSACLFPFLTR